MQSKSGSPDSEIGFRRGLSRTQPWLGPGKEVQLFPHELPLRVLRLVAVDELAPLGVRREAVSVPARFRHQEVGKVPSRFDGRLGMWVVLKQQINFHPRLGVL